VPYAVVLGIAAGLLEFVPLAGPLTAGGSGGRPRRVPLGRAGRGRHSLPAGLRAVQDYVVDPKIVGVGAHLNPLGVILCSEPVVANCVDDGGEPGVHVELLKDALHVVANRDGRDAQLPRDRAGGKAPGQTLKDVILA